MSQPDRLLFVWSYLAVTAGIVISILLPILRAMLPEPPKPYAPVVSSAGRQSLVVGVFSLLTALLVVAFRNGDFMNPYSAILAGYAWDSTLQRIVRP
jgi:hypothetical protein